MHELLERLAGLPQDQYGQRCVILESSMHAAVGVALINGHVLLKGISHKRVLVCLSEEGLLAIRMHQLGYSQVLHGSTP